MRTGKANVVAPLTSPENPPATNYVVVFLRSPDCLAVARAPFVSHRAEGGSQTWAAPRFGPRQHACCGPPDLFGPAQQVELGFKFIFGFYSFHRFMYIFKNMYLLDGRSK